MSELIEVETELHLTREDAAALLRRLADSLARHNEVEFTREGTQVRVAVPDEVDVEIEIEIDSDGGSLEVEISW